MAQRADSDAAGADRVERIRVVGLGDDGRQLSEYVLGREAGVHIAAGLGEHGTRDSAAADHEELARERAGRMGERQHHR